MAINAPILTLNPTGVGGGTVSISSTAGAVSVASTITSGSFFTGTAASGPFAIAAGGSVTGSGATITANAMQFDGPLNTGTGAVTLRRTRTERPSSLVRKPPAASH